MHLNLKINPSKSILITLTIKVIVFALLVFALYKQLFDNEQLQDKQFTDLLREINGTGSILLLLFVCMLMFINWSIEAYKWKLLIQKLTPIRFIRTFKAVWTGVTLGLFTPNRVGEFGGRILYVPRKFRIKAIVVSLIGSFSQNTATFLIGIISLVIFIWRFYNYHELINGTLILISIITITLLLLAYYNIEIVAHLFKKIKIFRRIRPYLDALKLYHIRDYNQLLALSAIRYMVYTAQYLIFLRLFGATILITDGIVAIGVIYLAQTVIPSFAIAEVLTRGSIASQVLIFYGVDGFISVAASTCIWLLNLIIPAALGYLFILRFNFFKNKQS